jgi:hypothetical protein
MGRSPVSAGGYEPSDRLTTGALAVSFAQHGRLLGCDAGRADAQAARGRTDSMSARNQKSRLFNGCGWQRRSSTVDASFSCSKLSGAGGLTADRFLIILKRGHCRHPRQAFRRGGVDTVVYRHEVHVPSHQPAKEGHQIIQPGAKHGYARHNDHLGCPFGHVATKCLPASALAGPRSRAVRQGLCDAEPLAVGKIGEALNPSIG